MTERYTKRIVCLANSRKPNGRCIAGREVTPSGFGPWLRPVSARITREVATHERAYGSGQDPSLLDIISIRLIRPLPHQHQHENHLLDPEWRWVKEDKIDWKKLQSAVDNPDGRLWLNGCSTRYGRNDRVPEAGLSLYSRSLYLIRPERLKIVVAVENGETTLGRRRVRARFDLCGQTYCLCVTDPFIEDHFVSGPDGEYSMSGTLLCVSLGEPYYGYAYKIVAAVITPEDAGDGQD